MGAIAAARDWLPVAVVAALGLFAVIEALLAPRARLRWLAVALALTVFAIVSTSRERALVQHALDRQTAQLAELEHQIAAIGDINPPSAADPPQAARAEAARPEATLAQVKGTMQALKAEIAKLQSKYNTRTIDPAIAVKMADYLRGFGSHRVVVSCIPGNVEAYDYANQIANVLRAAGWDATGPEKTAIYGTAPAMGIGLYVHGDPAPDTVKTLTAAFAKFNLPYHGDIASNAEIPDNETVEIYVAAKPSA